MPSVQATRFYTATQWEEDQERRKDGGHFGCVVGGLVGWWGGGRLEPNKQIKRRSYEYDRSFLSMINLWVSTKAFLFKMVTQIWEFVSLGYMVHILVILRSPSFTELANLPTKVALLLKLWHTCRPTTLFYWLWHTCRTLNLLMRWIDLPGFSFRSEQTFSNYFPILVSFTLEWRTFLSNVPKIIGFSIRSTRTDVTAPLLERMRSVVFAW